MICSTRYGLLGMLHLHLSSPYQTITTKEVDQLEGPESSICCRGQSRSNSHGAVCPPKITPSQGDTTDCKAHLAIKSHPNGNDLCHLTTLAIYTTPRQATGKPFVRLALAARTRSEVQMFVGRV